MNIENELSMTKQQQLDTFVDWLGKMFLFLLMGGFIGLYTVPLSLTISRNILLGAFIGGVGSLGKSLYHLGKYIAMRTMDGKY